MTINEDLWSGTVRCRVAPAGGTVRTVGVFHLSGGYGARGAAVTAPADAMGAARPIASNGAVIASARFSA